MSGVGENLDAERGQWNFKDINHNNFEEHVTKSVPGYENGHQYISFLSDYFVKVIQLYMTLDAALEI